MALFLPRHPGLYGDLGKKSKDLLDKDFPTNNKVEVKLKGPNYTTFDVNLTRNNDGSIFGSLNPKVRFPQQRLTLGASVDTKRQLKAEAILEDALPGLKTTLVANSDQSVTLEAEYKQEYFTVATSLNLLSVHGNKFTTAGVVGYNGFALGAQAEYNIDKWKTINSNFSYSALDWIASLYARANTINAANIVGLQYFQRLNPRLSFAAEAQLDVNKTTEAPKISIGVSQDMDVIPMNNFVVKGKVDTEGRLSLGLAQRINKNTKLNIGTSINANNFNATGHHTFGLSLLFEA